MIKKIKTYPGESLLVAGTGIFTYNIFDFSYTDRDGSTMLPEIGARELGNVAYYYKEETLFLIAIGAMLIVSGLLIMYKTK